MITTVAGNGSAGYSGDNGPAISAGIYIPHGVAVDASGNIYISDQGNKRIRKVNTAGTITTVAGNGTAGYSGDGGLATSASISYIFGVAVDSSGNIYIADYNNHRLRKVDVGGTITTMAGNGIGGYSGDNGPATSAYLYYPSGIAVDSSGNIYIADSSNNRVRKVDVGGTITTVAGNGTFGCSGDNGPATSASLNYPSGIAVDSSGNTFIADRFNSRIRKVNTAGIITTVAGYGTGGYSGDNGPATSASLNTPADVAVDLSGNIYIADSDNSRVRKVDTTGIITTVAGNDTWGFSGDGGPATFASLRAPFGASVDSSGNIYIADMYNHCIRKVDTFGIITTVAGNGMAGYSGDNGPATSASLNNPTDVAVDSSGNIYISDQDNNRVRKVDASGIIITSAGNGIAEYSGDNGPATAAGLSALSRVAVDSSGNIYIASNNRIRKVDTGGTITTVAGNGIAGYSGDNGPATSASFNGSSGVAVDSSGNIYIADTGNGRIRKVLGPCTGLPDGAACGDNNACIWNNICSGGACVGTSLNCNDNNACTTDACDPATGCFHTAIICDDGNACTNDSCNPATGCVFTPRYCDDNNICTSDWCDPRIGCVYIPIIVCNDNNPCTVDSCNPATGSCVFTAINCDDYNACTSDSCDPATGCVHTTIEGCNAVVIITTVAGNGMAGYSGDDVPASSASLFYPSKGAVDLSGNIYIADSSNNRIRKVDTSGTITTVAGIGIYGYSGDNGPAIYALLNNPHDVAVDLSGNIYIADTYNHCIRKIDPSGIITTVAGNGIGDIQATTAQQYLRAFTLPKMWKQIRLGTSILLII
jgi:sugar lactone lactonase YvrE